MFFQLTVLVFRQYGTVTYCKEVSVIANPGEYKLEVIYEKNFAKGFLSRQESREPCMKSLSALHRICAAIYLYHFFAPRQPMIVDLSFHATIETKKYNLPCLLQGYCLGAENIIMSNNKQMSESDFTLAITYKLCLIIN